MIPKQYKMLSIIYCLLLVNVASANLVIGDFETPDSFKKTWRAKRGTWGGSFIMKRTQLNSISGRYALETKINGSKKNTWPYIEYRFPKDQQELSKYKFIKINIFNATKEKHKIKGFFSMLSSKDKDKYVRVYFSYILTPGANILKIKLNAKRGTWEKKAKDIQPVDWKNVDRLQLFFDCPRNNIKLFIDNISLITNNQSDLNKTIIKESKITQIKSKLLLKPIKLDGRLTNEEWGSIPKSTILFQNNGRSAKENTSLQFAYDACNLYLGIKCLQDNISKIKAPIRKNDGLLWNDDNLEIFLQNRSEGKKNYYQLATNASGSRYDGKIANGLSAPSWDRPWQVSTFKGENFWSCEIIIPWRIFDFSSSLPPQWYLNIFRYNSTIKESSALSPTYGSYHVTNKFIPLKLPAPDLQNYCLSIENFELKKMTLGKNYCLLTVSVRRQDNFDFILQLQDVDNKKTRFIQSQISLACGIQKIKIPFEQKKPNSLMAKVLIKNSKKIPIAETSQIVVPMATALNLQILSPRYRNTIFAGQNIKEIVASLKVNVQKEFYNHLKIAVFLKNSKNQILAKRDFSAVHSVQVKFSTSKLLQGDYYIEALLKDKSGKTIAEKKQIIQILPYRSGQVTVGEDNFLRIDNKPFFPIILYSASNHLETLKKIGFNTIFSYAGWKDPAKELEKIEYYGEKGFYSILGIGQSILQSNRTKTTFKQMKAKLDLYINAFKNSKKILAYEILDEPNIHHKSYHKPYIQSYDYIKKLDPYHPMLLVQCGEIYMPQEHARFTDIYEFDYYPGYKLNGNSLQPLNATALRVRKMCKKLNNSRPVWPLLQGYDRMREWDKFNTGRISNYLETRSLFYSSIAEGATGLGFWCYNHGHFGCMAGRPNWLGIIKNVKELNQLIPVILAPQITQKLSYSTPEETKFHYIVKNYKGYFYIIGASTNKKATKINFSGKLLKNVKELKILGENRTVKVAKSKFADHFDSYQVNIYTNDPEPLKIANIAQNQRECLNYKEKIKDRNKNNILHQTFLKEKYTIKVQSPAPLRNDYFILDGLRNSIWYRGAKNLPAKLSVNLEKPKKMNRIVILSSSDYIMKSPAGVVRDFIVQIKVNNEWKTLKNITNNKNLKVEIKFPTQKVSAIRLAISKTNGKKVSIDELEAYCD